MAFHLWLERVNWLGCKQITQMCYSGNTKRLWKHGYRLFGGQFIHFMSGFKNTHSVMNEEMDRLA